MAALVEQAVAAPTVPFPRSSFTALVVSESAHRRAALCLRLRALGARELIEAASGAEARVRGAANCARDLIVIESGLPDGPSLPVLADLRGMGWRRVVLLTPRDDPYAVRAAIGAAVRGYIVTPDRTHPAPATPTARPRLRAGSSADELSVREVQVLQLVAEGNSNQAIGDELGLSALTVKSHLARIARKLGTGDRAEMVAHSMRAGLIR